MLKIIVKYILKNVLVEFFSKIIVYYLKSYFLKYNIPIPDLIYNVIEELLENIIFYCLEMLIDKF